jgi:hypothetical protein
VILARIQATAPDWLEFNHDYTFTVLIYGLVFALWYLWTVLGRSVTPVPVTTSSSANSSVLQSPEA